MEGLCGYVIFAFIIIIIIFFFFFFFFFFFSRDMGYWDISLFYFQGYGIL